MLLKRIDSMGIRERIVNFKGIVMGTSAGAMVQLDKFHITPENDGEEYGYCENGLWLISGFDIEVHYEENFLHLSGLITDLKLHGTKIYAMPNNGGLIVKGKRITPIGDVFEVTRDNLDMLQDKLDETVE